MRRKIIRTKVKSVVTVLASAAATPPCETSLKVAREATALAELFPLLAFLGHHSNLIVTSSLSMLDAPAEQFCLDMNQKLGFPPF